MYQVAIMPNNTSANLSLSFKTEEAARKAYEIINGEMETMSNSAYLHIADDFGYVFSIRIKDISYILFIDIEQSRFCEHERNVALARATKKLANIVSADIEVQELLGIGNMAPPQRSRIIQ